MEINITLQNIDDKPRTMSVVDDPGLSAPTLSLNNAGPRPKRRHSSGDETIKPPSPKACIHGRLCED